MAETLAGILFRLKGIASLRNATGRRLVRSISSLRSGSDSHLRK